MQLEYGLVEQAQTTHTTLVQVVLVQIIITTLVQVVLVQITPIHFQPLAPQ
jgi:hypothetical protein